MAGAYSTDLRSRVLAAVEAGQSPNAAARRSAVGRSTAYRWVAAARDEGRRAAKPMGGGPKPAIRAEAEAALRESLRRAIAPAVDAMQAARDAGHRDIDRPEEYRRLGSVCSDDQKAIR